MSEEQKFRGKRMREAMNRADLTSGQVAYRMNVSSGTVRGWTTGRRGIGPDDLSRFAAIVDHPAEYFLSEEYALPSEFPLLYELRRLTEQVSRLVEKVGKEVGYSTSPDSST